MDGGGEASVPKGDKQLLLAANPDEIAALKEMYRQKSAVEVLLQEVPHVARVPDEYLAAVIENCGFFNVCRVLYMLIGDSLTQASRIIIV